MRLSLIALALVLVALAGGCLQQPGPIPPTPTPVDGRYAPGDLLRGDLVAAGFDDTNRTPADVAIVILSSGHPVSGEYVYTLVRPVPGGWAYVYLSDDWIVRMGRDRAVFESYRLERIGHVDLAAIGEPTNATASRQP